MNTKPLDTEQLMVNCQKSKLNDSPKPHCFADRDASAMFAFSVVRTVFTLPNEYSNLKSQLASWARTRNSMVLDAADNPSAFQPKSIDPNGKVS